jgi:hypothetical protein
MFAWTAENVITCVAVAGMPDEPSTLPVALDVVSDALRDQTRHSRWARCPAHHEEDIAGSSWSTG